VNDVNEDGGNTAPLFTSSSTANAAENQAAAITLVATDVDSDSITYSISGTDAANFNIDASSGVVTFLTFPDYEAPTDIGADNVYNFTASAADGTDTTLKDITITVTNILDGVNPTYSEAAISINVDGSSVIVGDEISTALAQNATATTQYSLSGTNANLFNIDPETAAITVAATLTDGTYAITVTATTPDAQNTATQDITVEVLSDTGGLDLGASDAISDLFDQVWVEIDRVTAIGPNDKVHNLTSGVDIPPLDLLALSGVAEGLASISLPTGTYTQVIVHLKDDSKLKLFKFDGTKIEVSIIGNELELASGFIIGNNEDTTTKYVVDFDVEAWQEPLKRAGVITEAGDVTDNIIDIQPISADEMDIIAVDEAELMKIKVSLKGKVYPSSNILRANNGKKYYLEFPDGKSAQDALDLSDEEVNSGEYSHDIYIEGLLIPGIDGSSIVMVNEFRQAQVFTETKVYGKIITVMMDDNGAVESFIIKPYKSSKKLPTQKIRVYVDALATDFENGTIDNLGLGAKVKIYGSLSADVEGDFTATMIVIKDGVINPDRIIETINETESIEFDALNEVYSFELDSDYAGTALLISGSTLMDGNARTCFDNVNFAKVKLSGYFNKDGAIVAKEVRGLQKCDDDVLRIGFLKEGTSCGPMENKLAEVPLEGSYDVHMFVNIEDSGESQILEDTHIDILPGTGELKVTYKEGNVSDEEKRAEEENVRTFLGINLDAPRPGLLVKDGNIFSYNDVENIVLNTQVMKLKYVGGNIQINTNLPSGAFGYTALDGVSYEAGVIMSQDGDRDYHYKQTACEITVVDEEGNDLTTNTTDKHTRWIGENYPFDAGREVILEIEDGKISTIELTEEMQTGFQSTAIEYDDNISELLWKAYDEYEYMSEAEKAAFDSEWSQEFGDKTYADVLDDLKSRYVYSGLDEVLFKIRDFDDLEMDDFDELVEETKSDASKIKRGSKTITIDRLVDRLERKLEKIIEDQVTEDLQDMFENPEENWTRTQFKDFVLAKYKRAFDEAARDVEKMMEMYEFDADEDTAAEIAEFQASINGISNIYDWFANDEYEDLLSEPFDAKDLEDEEVENGDSIDLIDDDDSTDLIDDDKDVIDDDDSIDLIDDDKDVIDDDDSTDLIDDDAAPISVVNGVLKLESAITINEKLTDEIRLGSTGTFQDEKIGWGYNDFNLDSISSELITLTKSVDDINFVLTINRSDGLIRMVANNKLTEEKIIEISQKPEQYGFTEDYNADTESLLKEREEWWSKEMFDGMGDIIYQTQIPYASTNTPGKWTSLQGSNFSYLNLVKGASLKGDLAINIDQIVLSNDTQTKNELFGKDLGYAVFDMDVLWKDYPKSIFSGEAVINGAKYTVISESAYYNTQGGLFFYDEDQALVFTAYSVNLYIHDDFSTSPIMMDVPGLPTNFITSHKDTSISFVGMMNVTNDPDIDMVYIDSDGLFSAGNDQVADMKFNQSRISNLPVITYSISGSKYVKGGFGTNLYPMDDASAGVEGKIHLESHFKSIDVSGLKIINGIITADSMTTTNENAFWYHESNDGGLGSDYWIAKDGESYSGYSLFEEYFYEDPLLRYQTQSREVNLGPIPKAIIDAMLLQYDVDSIDLVD